LGEAPSIQRVQECDGLVGKAATSISKLPFVPDPFPFVAAPYHVAKTPQQHSMLKLMIIDHGFFRALPPSLSTVQLI
jgi:hypothetical protein